MVQKLVEINNGANRYSPGDSGTGVGTLNTLTDSGKAWETDLFKTNFKLIDSVGTEFVISSNTSTALTVVGTPANGAYSIKPIYSGFTRVAGNIVDSGTGTGSLNTFTDSTKTWIPDAFKNNYKLVDSAASEFTITANAATTLTVSGTPANGAYSIQAINTIENVSVSIEADKVEFDWTNSILSINKPVSNSSQLNALNSGNSYTYDPATLILTNTTGNFDSSLKIYDRIKIGTTEYVMQSQPSGATVLIQNFPTVPTSGTLYCYKTQKDYGVNLKRISETLSIEGYVVNDYVHNSTATTKYYAEEKLVLLLKIIADNAGNNRYANIVIRETSFMGVRFMTIDGIGCMACTNLKLIDDGKVSAPVRGGDGTTQRVDKIKIRMAFKRQNARVTSG